MLVSWCLLSCCVYCLFLLLLFSLFSLFTLFQLSPCFPPLHTSPQASPLFPQAITALLSESVGHSYMLFGQSLHLLSSSSFLSPAIAVSLFHVSIPLLLFCVFWWIIFTSRFHPLVVFTRRPTSAGYSKLLHPRVCLFVALILSPWGGTCGVTFPWNIWTTHLPFPGFRSIWDQLFNFSTGVLVWFHFNPLLCFELQLTYREIHNTDNEHLCIPYPG